MSRQKEHIRESSLRYRHGLGQNFIYDEALLETLAELSGVGPEDDVLEIGPGSGSLTRPLCDRAHHVLSLELDERLIPLLRAFLDGRDNFTLAQGDVMQVNLPELTAPLRRPFHVVANIPYYITTPLISLLLTGGLPIRCLSLMVQKEVADKLLASPGDEGWGMFAVRAQYHTEPRLALDVPAACFTPRPRVDSAFVVMPVRAEPAVRVRDEAAFFRVAGAAFALRRKTMANAMMACLHMERAAAEAALASAGLDPRIRGEKLSLEELARLTEAVTPA